VNREVLKRLARLAPATPRLESAVFGQLPWTCFLPSFAEGTELIVGIRDLWWLI
jgi:hypothetical protein